MTSVKLALVGCGGISRAHVKGYADLYARGCRDFEVVACCDVRAESAALRADEIAEYQGRRELSVQRAEDVEVLR